MSIRVAGLGVLEEIQLGRELLRGSTLLLGIDAGLFIFLRVRPGAAGGINMRADVAEKEGEGAGRLVLTTKSLTSLSNLRLSNVAPPRERSWKASIAAPTDLKEGGKICETGTSKSGTQRRRR